MSLMRRCDRCGQLGHMSRTCSATGPAAPAASSARFCSSASTPTAPRRGQQRNWVNFEENEPRPSRKQRRERLVEEQRPERPTHDFLKTSWHLGVVDTGAVRGMFGLAVRQVLRGGALPARLGESDQHGDVLVPRKRRLGGGAVQRDHPLGMGSIAGLLQVALVNQDAPLLLPIGLLRGLKARICCDFKTIYCDVNPSATSDMVYLPSGHCVADVANGLENSPYCVEAEECNKEPWHKRWLQSEVTRGQQSATQDKADKSATNDTAGSSRDYKRARVGTMYTPTWATSRGTDSPIISYNTSQARIGTTQNTISYISGREDMPRRFSTCGMRRPPKAFRRAQTRGACCEPLQPTRRQRTLSSRCGMSDLLQRAMALELRSRPKREPEEQGEDMELTTTAMRHPEASWRRLGPKVCWLADGARKDVMLQELVESEKSKEQAEEPGRQPEEPPKKYGVSKADIMSWARLKHSAS